ncbi:hypothetical protein Lfu02_07960 [Longispora fulva]|uniref:Uncharacterized protein (DUF1684 family) n=1 Tax=Longispora fulva TaxID=619741 RepID=A0A8J7GG17_9ACTN|nr:DUF1684 domain-containing protein [Longispora fulva]MBG6135338.1 uncharacterized protein (DUF1684 family) [Longispora fulva]GIG56424.1 hypothetical protein Lfu02_07960 [Longispora fulva]
MITPAEFVPEWELWHASRQKRVAATHGPLTLTGTHWLLYGDTVIDGVPGTWRAEDGQVRLTGGEGLSVTEGLLPVDRWLHYGEVDLLTIQRGEDLAVRVYDPRAEAVARFTRIDAFAPDPAWRIEAEFVPAADADSVHIAHSNTAREEDYPVFGTFVFEVDGVRAELVALHSGEENGAHLTFRDGTSGHESYGAARFLFVTAPPAGGPVTLDFNRSQLPPCAFSDAFVCPLPPPGNIVPFRIEAGEQRVVSEG